MKMEGNDFLCGTVTFLVSGRTEFRFHLCPLPLISCVTLNKLPNIFKADILILTHKFTLNIKLGPMCKEFHRIWL